ncbi:MAG: hypothetical protein JW994_06435, partial [Candidatus Omnitrophica bacterium]|nr:hypothetical protein [Candidatus Omnitrophota bacterium]
MLRFGKDGKLAGILGTGKRGRGNRQFDKPLGLALDRKTGYLYVADTNNHRIQKFDSNGLYIGTIGTGRPGSAHNQLCYPRGIDTDDESNLYVADTNNHRIQIFDKHGKHIGTIGTGIAGSSNNQLNYPKGVCVRGDIIYVSDTNNHRIQKFNKNRIFIGTIGSGIRSDNPESGYGFNQPDSVSFNNEGHLYVVDTGNHCLKVFTEGDQYLNTIGKTVKGSISQFNYPRGFAADSKGNRYVVDSDNNRILIFSKNDDYIGMLGTGEEGTGNYQFNRPRAVYIDNEDNIYVCDMGNHRIQKYNKDKKYVATLGTGIYGNGNYQFKYPRDVFVDDDGDIYVADGNNERVQIYNKNLMYVKTLGVTGEKGSDVRHLNNPHGVAVKNTIIYVADTLNNRIQIFDKAKNYQCIGTLGTGRAGSGNNQFNEPFSVRLNTQGDIFITDRNNHRIQIFNNKRVYVGTVGEGKAGCANDQLNRPYLADLDKDGNLCVADTNNHRIQIFTFEKGISTSARPQHTPAVGVKTAVERGLIGIYSIGVLGMSFYERMNADTIICRKDSSTTDWVLPEGKIKINGEIRDMREKLRNGLTYAPEGRQNVLPEVIMVCPYADQLNDFIDELIGYFRLMDSAKNYDLEDIPKFLLSSSGIYLENTIKIAKEKIDGSDIKNKEFFKGVLERRIFRSVAYQAGIRQGRGKNANYITGREKSYVILSLNGTDEDRNRIIEVIRSRGYDVRMEKRYLESEYDKALVNIIFNAFTQLYAVIPEEKRLLNVRFGDLFANSPYLPHTFAPQRLRDNSDEIRHKIESIGRSFVALAKAKGVYVEDATFENKFSAIERYILENIPGHYPSSFQLFLEKIFDLENDWNGEGLLTTEEFVLKPMIQLAGELGDTSNTGVLKNFEYELLANYREAIARRNDLENVLDRLGEGKDLSEAEKGILRYWTRKDIINLYGKAFGISENISEQYTERIIKAYRKVTQSLRPPKRISKAMLWRYFIPMALFLIDLKIKRNIKTLMVGINGMPGIGKTTIAGVLEDILRILSNNRQVVRISIDDFYYTVAEREARGIKDWGPGSHDLGFGDKLQALKESTPSSCIELPVFDKALRDRSVSPKVVTGKVEYVIFEGLGVGLESNGYSAFSKHIDYLISLGGSMEMGKEWRREAGWRDQHEKYNEDREAFEKDFEEMWSVIERQAPSVMDEVIPRSDLIIKIGEEHEIEEITTPKKSAKPEAGTLAARVLPDRYRKLNWLIRVLLSPGIIPHELGHIAEGLINGRISLKDIKPRHLLEGVPGEVRGPPALIGMLVNAILGIALPVLSLLLLGRIPAELTVFTSINLLVLIADVFLPVFKGYLYKSDFYKAFGQFIVSSVRLKQKSVPIYDDDVKRAPGTPGLDLEEDRSIINLINQQVTGECTENAKIGDDVIDLIASGPNISYRKNNLVAFLKTGKLKLKTLELGKEVLLPRGQGEKARKYLGVVSYYDVRTGIIYVTAEFMRRLKKQKEKQKYIIAQVLVHEHTANFEGSPLAGSRHAISCVAELDLSTKEAREKGVSDLNLFILDIAVEQKNITYLLHVLNDYEPKRDRTGLFKVALNDAISMALKNVDKFRPRDWRELICLYRHWLETGETLEWIKKRLDTMKTQHLITSRMLKDNFFEYSYDALNNDGTKRNVTVYIPEVKADISLEGFIPVIYELDEQKIQELEKEVRTERERFKLEAEKLKESPLGKEVRSLLDIATDPARIPEVAEAEEAVRKAKEENTNEAWSRAEDLSKRAWDTAAWKKYEGKRKELSNLMTIEREEIKLKMDELVTVKVEPMANLLCRQVLELLGKSPTPVVVTICGSGAAGKDTLEKMLWQKLQGANVAENAIVTLPTDEYLHLSDRRYWVF